MVAYQVTCSFLTYKIIAYSMLSPFACSECWLRFPLDCNSVTPIMLWHQLSGRIALTTTVIILSKIVKYDILEAGKVK